MFHNIVYDVCTFDQLRQLAEPSNWKLVVLDVYADWCGPCKKLKPFFEQLANEPAYMNLVLFLKCNIDRIDNDLIEYLPDISSLPTVLFMDHEGRVLERVEGLQVEKIQTTIDQSLELVLYNNNKNNKNINNHQDHQDHGDGDMQTQKSKSMPSGGEMMYY
jgi:thioredoxin 1